MPEAGTDSAVDSLVLLDLRGSKTVAVRIPADIMKYFSIPAPTAGVEEMQVITREPHSRRIYADANDTVGKVSTVRGSTFERPNKVAKGVTGTPVRVPTELKTAKGKTRYVTIRFPARATVADISNFLFEKCITKKPNHFIHNTVRYSVLKKKDIGTEPTRREPDEVA